MGISHDIDPLDVGSICLNCARTVRFVHKCLENEVNVNFYRHSDRDDGSDSVDVAVESNLEKDQVREGRDDEHQVYRLRNCE